MPEALRSLARSPRRHGDRRSRWLPSSQLLLRPPSLPICALALYASAQTPLGVHVVLC